MHVVRSTRIASHLTRLNYNKCSLATRFIWLEPVPKPEESDFNKQLYF